MDGKKCEEIIAKFNVVYGDLSRSMTTVRYWFNKFKRDRTYIFDEDHPGRPADVVTVEVVKKVHDMIFSDHRTEVRGEAKAVGVSYGRTINILHDMISSKQCLDLSKRNPEKFVR